MNSTNDFRPLADTDRDKALQIFADGFKDLQARNHKENENVLSRQVDRTRAMLADPTAYILGCYEDEELIGFAALTRPNEIIQHYLAKTDLSVPADIREIQSIYVRADKQGQGYGRALIQGLLEELEKKAEAVFCTDAAFKTSQQYWTEIIGTPTNRNEDYWGQGEPHMIWFARTERILDDLHDPYRPTMYTGY